MIHTAPQQFLLNTRRASSDDASRTPDRQRGMWSFLTWSFFLAQAVAAHEAYARGVSAGEADPDFAANDGANGGASNAGAGLASALGIDGFNIDPAAAAKIAAAVAAGLLSPEALEAMQADPEQFEAFVESLFGDGIDGGGAVVGDATGEGALPGQDPATPGSDTPTDSQVGVVIPVDVAIDLGLEVAGVLDVGLSVDGVLGIHIDLNTAPIHLAIDTADGLDLQLDLLGMSVGVDSDGGLGSLLALDDGLGGIPLSSAFEAIHVASSLSTDTLDSVMTVASSSVDTVHDIVDATTTIQLVGDVIEVEAVGNLFASAGTFLHAVDAVEPLHDFLNSAGQHTAYGIELQSSNTAGNGNEASLSLSSSGEDLASALDLVTDDTGSTLSNLVDSLHLKGLGDGFA